MEFDISDFFTGMGGGPGGRNGFSRFSTGGNIDPSMFQMFFGPGSSNNFNFSS